MFIIIAWLLTYPPSGKGDEEHVQKTLIVNFRILPFCLGGRRRRFDVVGICGYNELTAANSTFLVLAVPCVCSAEDSSRPLLALFVSPRGALLRA